MNLCMNVVCVRAYVMMWVIVSTEDILGAFCRGK